MLNRVFHACLRWTGKGYLIPFLEGMAHLGRPSGVLFPAELLEQGAAILLSGLNNTMAIQSNLDWVWPLWVERQADAEGQEFIPTAINLIMTNLTCRNWTSLGLEDSPREAMLDPAGMLTLHPYGWSVLPFVRLGGNSHFPPRMAGPGRVRQRLLEGDLPCVITEYEAHPQLEWKSEAMALRIDGEEAVSFAHVLRNRGGVHLSLRFGLSLRPYNPLTIGHINSIRYHAGLFKVNGAPGLRLLEEPQRVALSDRHHGDPLLKNVLIAGRRSLKSRSGIASGLAEYDLELGPGETRVIESLGCLSGSSAGPPPRRGPGLGSPRPGPSPGGVAAAKAHRRSALREDRGSGMVLGLPDPRLEEAFRAVKAHMHVFDDGDRFSPGTFLYHAHWFRDSAFIALAFENLGWGHRARPKLIRYPGLQLADGFFRSQRGEWDSNGQAMWTLVNHVRRGGDPDLLETWLPALLDGARWIERMRVSTASTPAPHSGLLPAGFSAEHFGPNDHYYWDNIWGIAGLEAARWAARKLGRSREAAWLADLSSDYRGDLAASMDWAWKRNGREALPCSPYRAPDSAAIGSLVALSPLDVLSAAEPWVRGTVDFLARSNLRDGLFFQRIVHTGLNPYLSVQLARAMMALGDGRWRGILEALMRRASPTWTWPEAMHPRMYGGCMGDGDHGWSAAEFCGMVRDMLVVERGGRLLLLPHAPAAWFAPGPGISVKEAPTLHGTVDFTFRNTGRPAEPAEFAWSLRRRDHQDAAPLVLVLPRAAGLEPAARPPSAAGAFPAHAAQAPPAPLAAPAASAPERHGDTWHIPLPAESGRMAFRFRAGAVPAGAGDHPNKGIEDADADAER
jgi:hypothetical protein